MNLSKERDYTKDADDTSGNDTASHKNGFKEIRQNGSHKFFENKETNRRTTVPYHSKDLKPGTEQKILMDVGLKQLPHNLI